jgi:hypothetical protein
MGIIRTEEQNKDLDRRTEGQKDLDNKDRRTEIKREEAGVRPRSRSFCFEKLYFGARPGFLLRGQTRFFTSGPDPVFYFGARPVF